MCVLCFVSLCAFVLVSMRAFVLVSCVCFCACVPVCLCLYACVREKFTLFAIDMYISSAAIKRTSIGIFICKNTYHINAINP